MQEPRYKSVGFMMAFAILLSGNLLYAQPVDGQKPAGSRLVFADDFTRLDTASWVTEGAEAPQSGVYVQNGKLVLDTKGGVTVWLKKKLKGKLQISYSRTVILDNGPNDRVSDLNQFWMASDPYNVNLFTRMGVLESYDLLSLYYVGMGGNNNSTTRFRKYTGNGERRLLAEFKDSAHLLKPNFTYYIKIIVDDRSTSFWVNGIRFFTTTDPQLLKEGYFGFRSTWSHQEIADFRVDQW